MTKTLWYVLGGAVLICILGFAYYALSPLFVTIKVDEALPQEQVATTTQSAPVLRSPAAVVGTTGHPASGIVRVVETEDKTYIRYENYTTINGPDIYVYLAKDLEAKEFVDLGRVRATEGNINYEIPAGVDASEYRYVLTWCKQFGVLFNYADLSEAQKAPAPPHNEF